MKEVEQLRKILTDKKAFISKTTKRISEDMAKASSAFKAAQEAQQAAEWSNDVEAFKAAQETQKAQGIILARLHADEETAGTVSDDIHADFCGRSVKAFEKISDEMLKKAVPLVRQLNAIISGAEDDIKDLDGIYREWLYSVHGERSPLFKGTDFSGMSPAQAFSAYNLINNAVKETGLTIKGDPNI